jgi:hypothetical protein
VNFITLWIHIQHVNFITLWIQIQHVNFITLWIHIQHVNFIEKQNVDIHQYQLSLSNDSYLPFQEQLLLYGN